MDLIADAQKHDVSVGMAFNPNEISTEHSWFQTARENIAGRPFNEDTTRKRAESLVDYFVWRECDVAKNEFPNNWVNVVGRTVWHPNDLGLGGSEIHLNIFPRHFE